MILSKFDTTYAKWRPCKDQTIKTHHVRCLKIIENVDRDSRYQNLNMLHQVNLNRKYHLWAIKVTRGPKSYILFLNTTHGLQKSLMDCGSICLQNTTHGLQRSLVERLNVKSDDMLLMNYKDHLYSDLWYYDLKKSLIFKYQISISKYHSWVTKKIARLAKCQI